MPPSRPEPDTLGSLSTSAPTAASKLGTVKPMAVSSWEKYGSDLVERARQNKLDPVIGRDDEIRNVIRILSRKTKNNPVLIGEPGVGLGIPHQGQQQMGLLNLLVAVFQSDVLG